MLAVYSWVVSKLDILATERQTGSAMQDSLSQEPVAVGWLDMVLPLSQPSRHLNINTDY